MPAAKCTDLCAATARKYGGISEDEFVRINEGEQDDSLWNGARAEA
jgi:hypothetical protein